MKAFSPLLLVAIAFVGAIGFAVGCSKNDPKPDSEVINIWQMTLDGTEPGDSVSATFDIKNDGTITTTLKGTVDGEEYEETDELYWKIEGDKFMFAFKDLDGDGEEDSNDELCWESYDYTVSSDAFILTDDSGESFEYTKYDATK